MAWNAELEAKVAKAWLATEAARHAAARCSKDSVEEDLYQIMLELVRIQESLLQEGKKLRTRIATEPGGQTRIVVG